MPLATTKVTATIAIREKRRQNIEGAFACFVRLEAALLDEREKERRKPADPGRRGKHMDGIDRDHDGPIKPSAAFGGMAEPGLADQKQGADLKESGKPPAAVPRQEGDHDGDRKEHEANDGHRAERRFKKEKAQIFGIDDAVKIARHIDQNEREPGDAGNRRDRRGDAQQDGCRAKRLAIRPGWAKECSLGM